MKQCEPGPSDLALALQRGLDLGCAQGLQSHTDLTAACRQELRAAWPHLSTEDCDRALKRFFANG